MAANSLAEEITPPKTKRSGFRKVRTGCLTCKIRRIKCDEGKPSCRRCLATGRVCDGYEAHGKKLSSTTRPSAAPILAPKLLLPRRDPDEIRSYRFFLDVASPSLATLFDFGFWLQEIPRICHADPAIWHAVVGLGAAYELYSRAADTSTATARLRRLVLAQSNRSIQSLVEPSARHHDKSRALSASILFTCISTIQGRHAETQLHLESARKLLMELSTDLWRMPKPEGRFSPTISSVAGDAAVSSLPVSIAAADAIVTYFEIQGAAIANGGLIHSAGDLGATEAFNCWRYYQAPRSPTESETLETSRQAWADHLVRANQAAESLINSMIYHAQQNNHLARRVKTDNDPEAFELLAASERPFQVTFRELRKVVRDFEETQSPCLGQRGKNPPVHFLFLMLNIAVIRLLFQRDLDMPDPVLREKDRPRQFAAILEIAEDILRSSDAEEGPPKPKPLMLGPLSMVAHAGSPQRLRRRAIALMREFPRRDGFSDSMMQARVFEMILEREQRLLREDRQATQTGGLAGEDVMDDGIDEEVPSIFRSFNSTVSFVGERSAMVGSRTWREALNNQPGETRLVHW